MSARLRLIAPLAVLGLFAVITGVVNYGRWGDPFTFANLYLYRMNLEPAHADNIARLHTYGVFNLERVPYGIMYYFFPIWALPSAGAPYQFMEPLKRLFDSYELPPSSFALTDPLLVGLFGLFLWRLARGRAHVASPLATTAVLIGLTIGYTMLRARLRCATATEWTFLPAAGARQLAGLNLALQDYGASQLGLARRVALTSVVVFGVVFFHGIMAVYKITPGGLGRVPPGSRPRLSRRPAGRDAGATRALTADRNDKLGPDGRTSPMFVPVYFFETRAPSPDSVPGRPASARAPSHAGRDAPSRHGLR